ncbi:hypothetical protein ACLOJK_029630 [Asimina triloba]
MGLELGCGGYGCVRLCTSRANDMKFACKITRKAGDAAQEIQIMHLLSGHPSILTSHDVFEDLECLHLIMEFCLGGDLFNMLKKNSCFSKLNAARVMRDLTTAL